jgi:hypothetical protein
VSLERHGDVCSTSFSTDTPRIAHIQADLAREKKGFRVGLVLAMNECEMKTTQQFDRLGQNCRPENITRNLPSNPTRVAHSDELAGIPPAAAIRISSQEKSL